MNAEMNALIDKAEREGKWLRSQYRNLWFSPAELRKAQSEGTFQWGAVNWELRDPKEKLRELEERAARLEAERQSVAKRILEP